MELREALGIGLLLVIALVYMTGTVDKVKRMFGKEPKKASPNKAALNELLRQKSFVNINHVMLIAIIGGLLLYGIFILSKTFISN